MSEIIGPPKDVALFQAALLIKDLFALVEAKPPIKKGLRLRVKKISSEIMYAILSDSLPPELLYPKVNP